MYIFVSKTQVCLIQPYLFDPDTEMHLDFSMDPRISRNCISTVNVDSIFFSLIKSPSFLFVDAAASYLQESRVKEPFIWVSQGVDKYCLHWLILMDAMLLQVHIKRRTVFKGVQRLITFLRNFVANTFLPEHYILTFPVPSISNKCVIL